MQKMINLLTIFFIIVIINYVTGCAVGVATVGATVGGILVYKHKSVESYASDYQISWTANNRIYGDKALYATNHITVSVVRGTVLLTGEATTQQYKQQAEDLIKSITGVQRIYNEITIGSGISFWQRAQDNAITYKIKATMLSKKDFDPSAVKVITENNIVYLMGVVSPALADQAVDIAKNTRNVTKIIKVFQYITN